MSGSRWSTRKERINNYVSEINYIEKELNFYKEKINCLKNKQIHSVSEISLLNYNLYNEKKGNEDLKHKINTLKKENKKIRSILLSEQKKIWVIKGTARLSGKISYSLQIKKSG